MADFQTLAYEYNRNRDYNCAESVLLISAGLYGFTVTPDELHLVSGFGGGMGCGSTCGAIAGSIAVLGRLTVKERAHVDPGFRLLCGKLTKALEARLGSIDCHSIMPNFRTAELGCSRTIAAALEVLDGFLKDNGLV